MTPWLWSLQIAVSSAQQIYFFADSSLFPRITNGNLNAPSIMVGEKAADHIMGNPLLAPANDRPFKHPDWQSKQR
jgi:choline dehydrogenase